MIGHSYKEDLLKNLEEILQEINVLNEDDEELATQEDIDIINRYSISFLAEGGGRDAYSCENNYVIKVPKSEDGELQSKNENEIYIKENLDILCETIVSKEKDIVIQKKLSMIDDYFYTQTDIIQYLEQYRPELLDKYKEKIEYLIKKYNLLEEDILKISSWGKDGNDNIYLFDFGCTNKIFNEYY